MVRDGIYYATALTAGGVLLSFVSWPWAGIPLFVLAAFCLYFFRDPERVIPSGPVAVSPADGKVRSEEHTSELQSRLHLVCRLLLEKKKKRHESAPQTYRRKRN